MPLKYEEGGDEQGWTERIAEATMRENAYKELAERAVAQRAVEVSLSESSMRLGHALKMLGQAEEDADMRALLADVGVMFTSVASATAVLAEEEDEQFVALIEESAGVMEALRASLDGLQRMRRECASAADEEARAQENLHSIDIYGSFSLLYDQSELIALRKSEIVQAKEEHKRQRDRLAAAADGISEDAGRTLAELHEEMADACAGFSVRKCDGSKRTQSAIRSALDGALGRLK